MPRRKPPLVTSKVVWQVPETTFEVSITADGLVNLTAENGNRGVFLVSPRVAEGVALALIGAAKECPPPKRVRKPATKKAAKKEQTPAADIFTQENTDATSTDDSGSAGDAAGAGLPGEQGHPADRGRAAAGEDGAAGRGRLPHDRTAETAAGGGDPGSEEGAT